MAIGIGRRRFIGALSGVAVAWPLAVSAQQPDRIRRIGALTATSEDDPEIKARIEAFERRLTERGWTLGASLHIDYRWGMGDLSKMQAATLDLLKLRPDVLITSGSPPLRIFQQATRTIPIVFVLVSEPVAQGFVSSLARPGGNITGFANLEPTMGAKWLEILKEIAPRLSQVRVMFNPANSGSILFADSAEKAGQKVSVSVLASHVQGAADIEAAITNLGEQPGGGLILPPDGLTAVHHELIIGLAARYRLPAIYALRFFTDHGGLLSYGLDTLDQYRHAAEYVDRILRGEKAADLPVQQPTKFELVINLKTAKALGLNIPATLLARADEVIE